VPTSSSFESLVADRYRLDALAGTGGMGDVYRALDLETGTPCAVKLLQASLQNDPGAAARAATEVATLASIHHDAVVRYLAHGSGATGPYLVMEWVEGDSLRARLDREGLTPSQALLMAARLVRALAVLHERDVVHRDVTPRNVMLEGGAPERAKLVDFGIARRAASPGLTATGTILGTPRYMAPEQIMNARRVDGRADVFALGSVLFEALTGRKAFDGDDDVALLARMILEEAIEASAVRRELPRAVDEVVKRMLSRDPRRRPFAGESLALELDAVATLPEVTALGPVRVLSRRPPPLTLGDDDDGAVPPSFLAFSATLRSATLGNATRSALLGRGRELAALVGATERGGAVSLWGPVGSGKTRVLGELARKVFDREVVLLDLSSVTDADAIGARVAAALGLATDDPTLLVRALSRSRVALLFDAADVLLEPLGALARGFLAAAPDIAIVVAARARWTEARTQVELAPLDAVTTLELLIKRLRDQGHAPERVTEVLRDQIVPRLEGNPLLVELAAARFGLLGAEGIATRLAGSLDLLGGARGVEYGFTLEEALEGSWALLGEDARRALAIVSWFAGPFELAVAEELLAAIGLRGLDVLGLLRNRSLVADAGTNARGGTRCVLSEPVRAFAARKRGALGLGGSWPLFATIVLEAAEPAAAEVVRSGDAAARARLDGLERDLESVVQHALLESGRGELALRAFLAADALLVRRAPLVTQLWRLDESIRASMRDRAPTSLMLRAYQARGRMLALRGRADEARRALEAALDMSRDSGDSELEASVLLDLGVAAHGAGDLKSAETCYEDALALRVSFENASIEARALGNLGAIAHDRHDFRVASRRYVEAIALVETSGDQRLLGVFLGNLAVLDRERGDLHGARRRFLRAIEALETAAETRLRAVTLGNLGVLELERGHLEVALDCLTRAREVLERFGDVHSEALALSRQAAVLALVGRVEDARKSLFLARRQAGSDVSSGVCDVAEAFLDWAEGRADEASARLHAVKHEPADRPLVDRSDDARALVRVLERRMTGIRDSAPVPGP
jgi:tetratricopeptide (TPR) repeat protein